MVTVQLYQPGIIDYKFSFAEEWNELTTQQLLVIAQCLFKEMADEAERKASVLYNLLNLHKKKLPPNTIKNIDAEDLEVIGRDLVQFIWEDNRLSKQPFKKLRINWHTVMRGPADDFDSITCGEYELAEIAVNKFFETKDVLYLAELAAVLYRPGNTSFYKFNRSNNTFTQYDYEKKIPLFMQLPQDVLFTIYLWYCGCRNWLTMFFPNVYGSGGGQPDMMAFTKCIHAAAGEKNGTREQVRMIKLKELLFEMEQQQIYANEIESKYGTQ